jgi:hypothetical protein
MTSSRPMHLEIVQPSQGSGWSAQGRLPLMRQPWAELRACAALLGTSPAGRWFGAGRPRPRDGRSAGGARAGAGRLHGDPQRRGRGGAARGAPHRMAWGRAAQDDPFHRRRIRTEANASMSLKSFSRSTVGPVLKGRARPGCGRRGTAWPRGGTTRGMQRARALLHMLLAHAEPFSTRQAVGG